MRNTILTTPNKAAAKPALGIPTGERILVVDDDDVLRGLNETMLNLAGYGTHGAADGEEALLLLATHEFHLVMTDCNMPGLDGVGLIRALRAAGSRIPIMMVSDSVRDDAGLPEDVRSEIAVALPKPASTREILAGIAHSLKWRPGEPGRTCIAHVFPDASPRVTRIAEEISAPTRGSNNHRILNHEARA